jgi:uncharacterized protein YjbI with pentapeptide repeats
MKKSPPQSQSLGFGARLRSAGFEIENSRVTSSLPVEDKDFSGEELMLGDVRVRFDFCKMKNVSWVRSVAKNGLVLKGLIAEDCAFDKSKWWNVTIHGGSYVKCTFTACQFYSAVLSHRVEFINCEFDGFSTRADSSLFTDAKFIDCNFSGITLSRTTVDGCCFEGCRFSGTLDDCLVRGAAHARRRRLFGIFGSARATTFRGCSFSGDFLKDVNIENGVILE